MGCDIHMHVEVFNRETGNWEERDDRGESPPLGEENWLEQYEAWQNKAPYLYNGRNYSLFAILANVRNGYGFAGCDTGDGFVPIAMPKGLPEDVSDSVQQSSGDYGIDGHSHSWITVQEILDYDWNRVAKSRGFVGESGFIQFKEEGRPESYCGGVFGTTIISNGEMEKVVAGGGVEGETYHTQVEWEIPYSEEVPYFLKNTLVALKELGTPEDVRMVFWFDN